MKTPLVLEEVTKPSPGHDQVLIRVYACGLCRTDLHIIDGELLTSLPLILGHQIVGVIEEKGKNVYDFKRGQVVGVPWLGYSCGYCKYCKKNQENLCDKALFTGYNIPGGFAEYTVAHHQYIFPLTAPDPALAPLLCAGMIGYRSLKKCGAAKKIGFYGFGASAHILIQIATEMGKEIYAFTRPGDLEGQKFARLLHASWTGGSDENPPCSLDAAIIFAPYGFLIPIALNHLDKGGCVVCAGIHMSDIPSFSYDLLWGERMITSVSNLTREDGIEFLKLTENVHPQVKIYSLSEGNVAIEDMRQGKIQGSAVLIP